MGCRQNAADGGRRMQSRCCGGGDGRQATEGSEVRGMQATEDSEVRVRVPVVGPWWAWVCVCGMFEGWGSERSASQLSPLFEMVTNNLDPRGATDLPCYR
jgi:hypothetical protein